MTGAAALMLDLLLVVLVAFAGWAALAGRGVFRAVVFFIAYGLLVALGWVRLGAVNVALAEAAIGAGLTGVLLLATVGRLERAGAARDVPPVRGAAAWVPALAGLAVTGALVWAWFALPLPESPGPQLAEALPRSGVENPVTAVLLNFRSWDTLLEAIVLLAALLGVWMLGRDGDWTAPLGLRQHVREGGVMAGFGRVLPPLGLLVGVWLLWAGADAPGGAFQGGTVLAAVIVVALMAGVAAPPGVDALPLRVALVLGPGVFLGAGLVLAALGAGFLTLPEAQAKAVIVAVETALTLSIAVTLAGLVLGPPTAPNGAAARTPDGARP